MSCLRNSVVAGLGAAVAISAGPALGQSSIRDLGGSITTGDFGISGDGTTVFGPMTGGQIWSAAGGYRMMPPLYQGSSPGLSGMSYDGSVVVGKAAYWDEHQIYQQHAYRWTQAGGYQVLGIFGQSRGVNYDGSVVGGDNVPDQLPLGSCSGYRWTSSGTQSFGLGYWGQVYGVSGDGSTLVAAGIMDVNHGPVRAHRWTASGGLQDLAPGFSFAYAYATNTNGSVVVGAAGDGAGALLPTRWTAATGTQLLAVPVGTTHGTAKAVSGDGSLAVGQAGAAAALWTASGYVGLEQYLRDSGVDMSGWHLSAATGISADGTRIVGYGTYNGGNRAWLATIPAPGGSMIGIVGAGLVIGGRRRR